MSRVAQDLRQPAQLWMLAAARATLALAQGRFAEAPELIERAAAIGEPRAGMERGRGAHAAAVHAPPRAGSARRLPARGQRPRARVSRHRSCTAPCSRTSARALGRADEARVARARDHAARPVGLARRRAVVRQHLPARRDLRDRRRPRARGLPLRPPAALRRPQRGRRSRARAGLRQPARSASSPPRSSASRTRSGTSCRPR